MSTPTYVDRSSNASISDALTDLALDMRWSFNHAADRLWEQLDPELWELTHNPWVCCKPYLKKNCKVLSPTQTLKNY